MTTTSSCSNGITRTAMQAHPEVNSARISGYTDRLGSQAYNLKVSKGRAEAVKTYLVDKGNYGSRLVTVGKGEANPVVHATKRIVLR